MEFNDIEKLVELAVKYNVVSLEADGVKIIPRGLPLVSKEVSQFGEMEKRLGRPLTVEEMQDEVLFGPGGSLKVRNGVI